MTELTGSALYLKFGTQVLSSDFRTFDSDEKVDAVDASAGADTNRTYLTTLKDGTATCQLVHQTSGTALWAAVAPGSSGTLEWGEEGTASGKAKHTVTAFVKNRRKATPYSDIMVLNVDFQFNGAVTDSSY